MEQELDNIDSLMDLFAHAEGLAKAATTKHKHMTAAEIKVSKDSVTKARECAPAETAWFERQTSCDELTIAAQVAKMKLDQAIRRWETARSVYSATRKVA